MIEGLEVTAEHFHIVCISRKEEMVKIAAVAKIDANCQELKSNDDKLFGLSNYSVKIGTLKAVGIDFKLIFRK